VLRSHEQGGGPVGRLAGGQGLEGSRGVFQARRYLGCLGGMGLLPRVGFWE